MVDRHRVWRHWSSLHWGGWQAWKPEKRYLLVISFVKCLERMCCVVGICKDILALPSPYSRIMRPQIRYLFIIQPFNLVKRSKLLSRTPIEMIFIFRFQIFDKYETYHYCSYKIHSISGNLSRVKLTFTSTSPCGFFASITMWLAAKVIGMKRSYKLQKSHHCWYSYSISWQDDEKRKNKNHPP